MVVRTVRAHGKELRTTPYQQHLFSIDHSNQLSVTAAPVTTSRGHTSRRQASRGQLAILQQNWRSRPDHQNWRHHRCDQRPVQGIVGVCEPALLGLLTATTPCGS